MSGFDIKVSAFRCFVNLAIKKQLTTAKKLNAYFNIKTGGKLLKGEYWHHETSEYTKMTAKMILDGLPKNTSRDSDD
jgi:hypothetical protein